MAVYFLERSTTYRQQISTEVYRRREIVCQYLKDDYKVRKFKDDEAYQSIVSELATDNIAITLSTYQADKVLLRRAYLWLTANEAEKVKFTNTNSPSGNVGINCLIKDGIRTWADLKLEDTTSPAFQEAPAPEPSPVPELSLVPSQLFRLKLFECRAAQEVVETFSQLVEKLEVMLTENEKLKVEIARLSEENEQQSHQTEDFETYIQFVENENATLEERLKTIREGMRHLHSASLEEIAEQHPEFPELLTIAQRMKERPNRRQEQINKVLGRLPQTFVWANDSDSIRYEQHFLRSLSELKPNEQEQVIRQLEILAQQGSEQASLHTNKSWTRLPYSPTGCLVSRGADDLRFTWKKNGEIIVYWLYRKGDTRVRQTEQ